MEDIIVLILFVLLGIGAILSVKISYLHHTAESILIEITKCRMMIEDLEEVPEISDV